MISSLTSRPDSISALLARPSSVPACTASRRMSPVEILGTPRTRANRSACVPLPAPGAPNTTSRTATADRPYPRRPRIRVFFMNPS
jgi:hypothetical protein